MKNSFVLVFVSIILLVGFFSYNGDITGRAVDDENSDSWLDRTLGERGLSKHTNQYTTRTNTPVFTVTGTPQAFSARNLVDDAGDPLLIPLSTRFYDRFFGLDEIRIVLAEMLYRAEDMPNKTCIRANCKTERENIIPKA